MNALVYIDRIPMKEAEELLRFSSRTFYEAFAHRNSASDIQKYMNMAFTLEQIRSELQNPDSEFYFARLDGNIVGYLKLNFGNAQTDLKDTHALEIERIYVDKNMQGKQVGQKLLEFAIQVARKRNLELVWLGVWEQNTGAIRFYERHGFKSWGSHPFLLGDDWQTDIMMKLVL